MAEEPTTAEQPTEEPAGSVVEPAKKKNGGLIAIIAIFVVALIGCAVAAIIMLDPFGFNKGGEDDRVPKALVALFAEGAPTNVAMDGDITLYSFDENSPVVSLEVDFVSKTNLEKKVGTAEATITANFSDDTSFKFDADEIHTEKGDLYLKLSGILEAIENYQNQAPIVDCTESEDEDCAMSTETSVGDYISLLDSFGVVDVIDDEWILIPSTSFSNVDDLAQLEDGSTQCLIDAVGTIGKYTDNLAAAYDANPFITYSTQDLKITKKKDNLYRLSIDNEAFSSFINAMGTSGFVNELNACLSKTATNTAIDAE